MNILFSDFGGAGCKTYKTYDNAVKEAKRIIGDRDIRVIISVNEQGRFFPVAIGNDAFQRGMHFHMASAN